MDRLGNIYNNRKYLIFFLTSIFCFMTKGKTVAETYYFTVFFFYLGYTTFEHFWILYFKKSVKTVPPSIHPCMQAQIYKHLHYCFPNRISTPNNPSPTLVQWCIHIQYTLSHIHGHAHAILHAPSAFHALPTDPLPPNYQPLSLSYPT